MYWQACNGELRRGMLFSTLYPNRSIPEEARTQSTSTRKLEVASTPDKVELKLPMVKKGKLTKKDKP